MYKPTMMMQEDWVYNFRIYKMIHMLWKLEVIDNSILIDHIFHLDNMRPVGVMVDWHNYTVQGGPNNLCQF